MAHRVFRDADGVEWAVWSVEPIWAERRVGGERRAGAGGELARGADRRGRPDRRRREELRVRVSAGFEAGWLTFESEEEKRRYAPVPAAWESLPDDQLARLCGAARSAAKRRGRFVE